MAHPFLYLDIDSAGIHAFVVESSFSSKKILDQSTLNYEDLESIDTEESLFQRGMAVIASQIDLDICSEAVIFLDSSQISYRNLSLPFFNKKKINQILPFELSALLPMPENTYVTDFLTQEICFQEDQQLILSASIPKTEVGQFVDSLKPYKVKPLVITPKGYAGAVCFMSQARDISDFLFVYLGNCDYTIVLVVDKKPVVVRSLGALTGPTPDIPADISADIARAVHQTLTGFSRQSGGVKNFNVILGVSHKTQVTNKAVGNLKKKLADHPCLTLSSLSPMDMDTAVLEMSPFRQPDQLLNFCKSQFVSDTLLRRYKAPFILTLVLVFFLAILSFYNIQKEIAFLEQQISQQKDASVAIYRDTFAGKPDQYIPAPLPMMEAKLNQALKKNRTDGSKKSLENISDVDAVDLLFELSSKIPDTIDVDLDRFLLNHGHLVISGSVDTFKNVDRLKGLLETSELFEKVSISSAEASKAGNRVFFKFIIGVQSS